MERCRLEESGPQVLLGLQDLKLLSHPDWAVLLHLKSKSLSSIEKIMVFSFKYSKCASTRPSWFLWLTSQGQQKELAELFFSMIDAVIIPKGNFLSVISLNSHTHLCVWQLHHTR